MSAPADGPGGLRRLLWHPHEKLWNWPLVFAIRRRLPDSKLRRGLVLALIGTDSLLLTMRVWARRVSKLPAVVRGRRSRSRGRRPRVLYIDCGVHKRGEQVRFVHRCFAERYDLQILGFEASGAHVRDAAAALEDLDGVRLHHLALVGPDHVGEEVRLYKSAGEGKADSLFETGTGEHEVVPARRLSQVLREEGYVLDEIAVVLRMNIEGAERLVIEDLIDAGLHSWIDGYYGMWDDLSKSDPAADERFRALLADNGISKVTFNDRDLLYGLRRRAIRTDIGTTLLAGLARVARASSRR